ncbi:tetraspanin-7-like isoform X1 [Apium graveolens]|uniref:tetraspanin-7-like isoform X1 n=1 Tax=Apium graveolens TaxID=4045 RepID=UPI003D795418
MLMLLLLRSFTSNVSILFRHIYALADNVSSSFACVAFFIISGCCKPSDSCNFTYVSPTNWTKTTNAAPNTDCALWDNDPSVLCFNCQSCKAGMLDNIKSDWKRVAVVNVIFLICLIIVYSIGCCAFRNNREENSWKRYP